MTSEAISELTKFDGATVCCKLIGDEAAVVLALEFEAGLRLKFEMTAVCGIEFSALDDVALVN